MLKGMALIYLRNLRITQSAYASTAHLLNVWIGDHYSAPGTVYGREAAIDRVFSQSPPRVILRRTIRSALRRLLIQLRKNLRITEISALRKSRHHMLVQNRDTSRRHRRMINLKVYRRHSCGFQ